MRIRGPLRFGTGDGGVGGRGGGWERGRLFDRVRRVVLGFGCGGLDNFVGHLNCSETLQRVEEAA